MHEVFRWLVQHLVQLAALLPVLAIDVPSAAEIAEKYVRVTAGRSTDYATGVSKTPPAKFEGAAVAAADSYAQGVQQAISENRFAGGLQGSGAKWSRNAQGKGQARFGDGVSKAKEDMASGIAPYVDALKSLTLAPRGPRGDPRNVQRVEQVMTTLNMLRRQRK